eukprot:9295390-Alexandrium_andersonii.AAC.1
MGPRQVGVAGHCKGRAGTAHRNTLCDSLCDTWSLRRIVDRAFSLLGKNIALLTQAQWQIRAAFMLNPLVAPGILMQGLLLRVMVWLRCVCSVMSEWLTVRRAIAPSTLLQQHVAPGVRAWPCSVGCNIMAILLQQ